MILTDNYDVKVQMSVSFSLILINFFPLLLLFVFYSLRYYTVCHKNITFYNNYNKNYNNVKYEMGKETEREAKKN